MPAYDASDDDDHIGDADDEGGAQDGAQDGERIAKTLARAGVASRREVERLIESGRVALNGQVLTTPAVKVAPGDIVTVDGAVVGDAEPTRVFRYHKPPGLLTSHNDPQGRPTVFAHLPPGLPRLLSVGRLDLNSEGLLLLTNDGALSRALELPSSGWTRVYRARAFGDATQEKLDRLKAGVTVEGVKYGPIDAKLDKAKDGLQGRNVWITVTLTEGKNREVRRVLEHLGLKVNRLLRLAYGPFALGDLGQGEVEEIGPRVIREQLEGLIDAASMPRGDRPQFAGTQGMTGGRRAPTPSKLVDAAARRAQAGATAEAKPKLEYKPGWAKPKSRPSGHAPSKAPKASAKGPPKFERAKFDHAKTDRPRFTPEGERPTANRGRTGRVMARAEDVLPGASPRGPTKAPAREPERKAAPPKGKPRGLVGKAYHRPDDKARGGKAPFVNSNDGALRDAAAKGAARDAERRGPARGAPGRGSPSGRPDAKPFTRGADAPRGSGAHRTGPPVRPRTDDDAPMRAPSPARDSRSGGKPSFGRSAERGDGAPRPDAGKRPPAKGGAFVKGGGHRSDAPADRPKGPPKGPPRSGPPRSGPARSGPPRSGPAGSGPARSGPPRSGGPKGGKRG